MISISKAPKQIKQIPRPNKVEVKQRPGVP